MVKRSVRPALDVVSLEGPEHVADHANRAYETANDLAVASAVVVAVGPIKARPGLDPDQLHRRLQERISSSLRPLATTSTIDMACVRDLYR